MTLTQRARQVFADDTYATQCTGINIDNVEPDCTTCSLPIGDSHRNAKGAVMGGVIFTLADFAFAIAANTECLTLSDDAETKLQWVSSSSTIHFLGNTKGNTLTASTLCLKKGKRQSLYQITVSDNDGRTIAIVTTAGTKIPN